MNKSNIKQEEFEREAWNALDEIDLIDESFYKEVKKIIKSDDSYIIATVFYGLGILNKRK